MTTSIVTAKRPAAAPAAATAAGIMLALAVTAAGAAGIHDTLHATGVIGGSPWIGWVAGKAAVLRPADWMIYAGIGAVLVGLWFLISAVKPRRRTHLAVGDGIWIRRGDIARLAADTARATNAVTSATAKAKARTVRVTATATSADTGQVGADLAAAITHRLQAITPTPRVRTRVTVEEN